MSGPVGSQHWMYASGGFYDYTIDQSLRFNDGDSPALSKTYSTAQTNTKIITVSVWVKRANLGIRTAIMFAKSGSSGWFEFGTDDKLRWNPYNTGYNGFISTRVFRDTSSWYHIVATADSDTQSGANIYNVYVNGEQLTNSDGSTHVPDDTATKILANGITTYIGDDTDGAYHFDGYLAEMHVIDGSVVAHTEFGETSNGIWVPKEYSGSYGNNGFYLSFADSSAIGDDLSGNTNDFTVSNLAAADVVPDSPTNTFATANVLARNTSSPWTTSEGNLKILSSSNNKNIRGNFLMQSGKWYWETRRHNANNSDAQLSDGVGIALASGNVEDNPYQSATNWSYYSNSGNKYNNNTSSSYGDSWNTAGDIIGVAFDADNGAIWFSKNGTWQNSATASEIAAGTTTNAAYTGLTDAEGYVCNWWRTGGTNAEELDLNFGQNSSFNQELTGGDVGSETDGNGIGLFKYAVPSGFLALCASNLPEPAIGPNSGLNEQSDDYFNTVLYTGDGTSSNGITGVGFQPDWVWIKQRTDATSNQLFDVIRGVTKGLRSDITDAEYTNTNTITSFDSDGFTVGTANAVNGSSDSLVSWNWKAGGTAVSNTDGTITSSVSANQDAGFSIATYTGDNASGASTVGHGLGVAPSVVIIKRRDTTGDWIVGHDGLATNAFTNNKFLKLEVATSVFTNSVVWGSQPTTSVVQITTGTGATNLNASGGTYVMYSFAEILGFSKFGSYTGNGNSDGTFVYTGFRPAWVMARRSSSTGGWHIFDNKRPNAYNVIDKRLEADNSDAENSTSGCKIDLVSNGFKFRGTFDNINGSSATHIYLAFAEAPFKYANAR